jgi:hypothetical protein
MSVPAPYQAGNQPLGDVFTPSLKPAPARIAQLRLRMLSRTRADFSSRDLVSLALSEA